MNEILNISHINNKRDSGGNIMHRIAVVGMGYVGISIATLLAQHNEVIAVDVVPDKIDMIQNKRSPIVDADITSFFDTKKLHLSATLNLNEACANAEYCFVAVPTDYDSETNAFDTRIVEEVIAEIQQINPSADRKSVV